MKKTREEIEDEIVREALEEKPQVKQSSLPSLWWYLVPFLFGILGGLIAYACVKSEDKKMAHSLLVFGILWGVITAYFGLLLFA